MEALPVASRLQGRIRLIEQQAAPLLERARERMIEIEKLRAYIRPELESVMRIAEYCGLPDLIKLRMQIESDWIEQELLILAEYAERFGDDEGRTHKKMIEAIINSDIKFYKEIYGQDYSHDDVTRPSELRERVIADIEAGIPASESKAVQEIIKSEAMRATRLKKHTDDFAAHIAGRDSRIPDWFFNDEPGFTS